jgi:hypothetical protein
MPWPLPFAWLTSVYPLTAAYSTSKRKAFDICTRLHDQIYIHGLKEKGRYRRKPPDKKKNKIPENGKYRLRKCQEQTHARVIQGYTILMANRYS